VKIGFKNVCYLERENQCLTKKIATATATRRKQRKRSTLRRNCRKAHAQPAQADASAQPDAQPDADAQPAPVKRIGKLSELDELDADTRARIVAEARTPANVLAGTKGQYATDASGAERRDKIGRKVPVYTPRRDANAVAVMELENLRKRAWAGQARTLLAQMADKRGTEFTPDEVAKLINGNFGGRVDVPKSWKLPAASKPMWARVLGYISDYRNPRA
jgi:hypothetical protein